MIVEERVALLASMRWVARVFIPGIPQSQKRTLLLCPFLPLLPPGEGRQWGRGSAQATS